MKTKKFFIFIISVIISAVLSIFVSCSKEPQAEIAPRTETNIESINKYGNVVLSVTPETMQALGYETADTISVKIGENEIEMPIGTAYSDVDSGDPVCVFKTDPDGGRGYVILAVNSGNFASFMNVAEIQAIDADPGYRIIWNDGFDEKTAVIVSLSKKQGYSEEYKLHQLSGSRTNKRDDYSFLSDAEYANFREISTTGMGKGTLFRSSSPINPSLNRNTEADEALLYSLVNTVVNMSDSESVMKSFDGYRTTAYSKCNIIALNMGMDFQSEEFEKKLAEGLTFIASQNGPYLIHCKEGKDRTGFAAAVLECLMGADINEVTADYMLTFYNYYGIASDAPQYSQIAESNIVSYLEKAFGAEALNENDDLALFAEKYLEDIGMSKENIAALKTNLSKDYGGTEAMG